MFGSDNSSSPSKKSEYVANMISKFISDYERRKQREELGDKVSVECGPHLGMLRVEIVELYAVDNCREHRTEQYDLVLDGTPTPVLRRGFPFYYALRFDRPCDHATDTVQLHFRFGPNPSVTKGTLVILLVNDNKPSIHSNNWEVKIHRVDSNTHTLQVKIPSNAPVGLWHCMVQTGRKESPSSYNVFNCKEDIYILFNPWCAEDPVHMEREDWRQAYTLDHVGKVWLGSARQPLGRRWDFGQFDHAVLPAIICLLELSPLPHEDWGRPLLVTRALADLMFAGDGRGLLVERWDGCYKDGVPPTFWTGSTAIFEKFLQSSCRPVKYGQNWISSAVTVTLCRALGIPCRSVTNYMSAHNANHSLKIDRFFDQGGDEIPGGPDGTSDTSCWSFHPWNEVWTARPDLPKGYGGWQAIDTSWQADGGIYRCGPAPLEGIRRGHVGLTDGGGYIFSKVNSDMYKFQEDSSSVWGFSVVNINKNLVGNKLVTKHPEKDDDDGNTDLEDITNHYKSQEMTDAERTAMMNAARGQDGAAVSNPALGTEADDVTFDIVETQSITFGQGFAVTVSMHNKSENARNVESTMAANTVTCKGTTMHQLKKIKKTVTIQPNQREMVQLDVGTEDYLDKITEHGLIKIYVFVKVRETLQTWATEEDIALRKPKLKIQVLEKPRVGQDCHISISFHNPLSVALNECVLNIEGHGWQRPTAVNFSDVKPQEMVNCAHLVRPKKSGSRKLLATFHSKQLQGVFGSATIFVEK